MSLGLLWIFLATPLSTLLYGTVFGIAVALTIQDSPVSTQAFKSAFLQLGPDLTFDDARALIPYLRELGVSHLYLSPSLQARQGSRGCVR